MCWALGQTRKTKFLNFRSFFLVEGEDTEPTKIDSKGARANEASRTGNRMGEP